MADYVSSEEIMGLARQIKDLAVLRRGEELQWATEGAYDDKDFDDPKRVNPNIVKGGTSSDYATLKSGYEWIVQAFQNTIGPEPSGLDGAIASMDQVRNKLRGGGPPMVFNTEVQQDGSVRLLEADASRDTGPGEVKDRLISRMATWQGDAADNFKENYAVKLPGVIGNQVLITSALRSAVSTNRTVYVMARDDLKGVAKATIDALNFKTGSDGPSVTLTLSVVSAALAVTAACVTGPGAIIFFTVASSAAAVTKDIIDENAGPEKPKGKEYHVGGHTVDAMLSSCADLLSEISNEVYKSEDSIIKGLDQNYQTMTGAGSKEHFVAPRPLVADMAIDLPTATSNNGFYAD